MSHAESPQHRPKGLAEKLGSTFAAVIVINGEAFGNMLRDLYPGAELRMLHLDLLDRNTLDEVKPDCVVAPLFSADADVLEVAERLAELSYIGVLLAVSPPIPNPKLIRAEIKAISPDIVFDLITIPS
jgi:hypothetical protein